MNNAETFEYAIRKDIRNNPIVREVDERRVRELWRSVAIGVSCVAVLLFSAWQHFELLKHGYRLEQMQRERAEAEEVNRHLRLEIETLRSPRRIEGLATTRLHLVAPDVGDTIIIERVVPPAPPGRSVVASRDLRPASDPLVEPLRSVDAMRQTARAGRPAISLRPTRP